MIQGRLGQYVQRIVEIDPTILHAPLWPKEGESKNKFRKIEFFSDIVVNHPYTEIKNIASDALLHLDPEYPALIDAFCTYWLKTGHPLLENILISCGYTAKTPDELHMLTALKTHKYSKSPRLKYGDCYRSEFGADEFCGSLTSENLYSVIKADNYKINLQTKNSSLERLNELLRMPKLAYMILEKNHFFIYPLGY